MDKKRNWFGLSTEKDGSYAYLMVASSAWMSTFIYGYNVTCSLLTGKKPEVNQKWAGNKPENLF